MPFGSQPRYEVLSRERIDGPLDFMKVKMRVDSGQYTLDDSLREKGDLEWEPIRVALKRDKRGTIITLPIFGAIFFAAGAFAVYCGFRSFVPGSGVTPPSHAPGAAGVVMMATGFGLGLLTYNIHAAPLGKLPRKMTQVEVALYWGGVIAGLLTAFELP